MRNPWGINGEYLHVQMVLSMRLCIFDPLLQDILCLLHELAVQIDGIRRNPPRRIVLTENELGCLSVILLHLAAVGFSLLRELLCKRTVATLIGMSGLIAIANSQLVVLCDAQDRIADLSSCD